MKTRLATLIALLSLLPAVTAMGKGDDPEPALSSKRYASPKAVFDAYVAAGEKKDYKTALACLTPEALKDQAAFVAYVMLSFRKSRAVSEELKKTYRPVFDAMDKHGLTEKATKDLEFEENPLKLPEKARLALRKLIKKPGPFLIDLAAASAKVEKGLGGGQPQARTTLEGLKIQGNRATGKIVSSGFTAMKQKVTFVKSNGGWKMAPATEYETDVPLPPPPPPKK